MKDFINKLYRNHSLIYKLFLFIATTFLIVYLFPKSGRFKYNFERGKPWQSENLYAPFNFAIKKAEDEISLEKQTISDNAILYFNIDSDVKNRIDATYKTAFNNAAPDSIPQFELDNLFNIGQHIIDDLNTYGIFRETSNFDAEKSVVILDERVEKQRTSYKNVIKQENLSAILDVTLTNQNLDRYKGMFTALFFDAVEPNLDYDKAFTDSVLQEELDRISYTRGSIERETLIISKGEVVEGDKFQILKSLESEYESQVWNESNYNWIVFAYTLLVALALLMLLLFLRKYRKDVFENNTKGTFIFFNILLMVLITTLVVNYNSQYIYVVPICILPLVLKAFFDARLGLFAHVVTVLLLGLIVPNSYEYMFLQILAGIVTILTISELYKRANLFISVGQITLVYIIAYFAFFVIHEGSIETIRWETFGLFALCGLATLFVQPLIYAYEKMFG